MIPADPQRSVNLRGTIGTKWAPKGPIVVMIKFTYQSDALINRFRSGYKCHLSMLDVFHLVPDPNPIFENKN